MLRQRLKSRTPALALVGHVLVFVLACALIFYGAVLALLAFKAMSASTLDGFSAYRTVYDKLAGLRAGQLSDTLRIVAVPVGLLAFVLFGYLALKHVPRPYLDRHDFELADDTRGTVTVAPRAIERIAETAATRHPSVTAAAGRYGIDELTLAVSVRHAKDAARTLTDVQAAVAAGLEQHGLPATPVHLTLTGYERRTQRELD